MQRTTTRTANSTVGNTRAQSGDPRSTTNVQRASHRWIRSRERRIGLKQADAAVARQADALRRVCPAVNDRAVVDFWGGQALVARTASGSFVIVTLLLPEMPHSLPVVYDAPEPPTTARPVPLRHVATIGGSLDADTLSRLEDLKRGLAVAAKIPV